MVVVPVPAALLLLLAGKFRACSRFPVFSSSSSLFLFFLPSGGNPSKSAV
jgi:hypothetical protein